MWSFGLSSRAVEDQIHVRAPSASGRMFERRPLQRGSLLFIGRAGACETCPVRKVVPEYEIHVHPMSDTVGNHGIDFVLE